MPYTLKECPDCGRIINISVEKAGEKTVCPECGSYMNLVNTETALTKNSQNEDINKIINEIIKESKISATVTFVSLLFGFSFLVILGLLFLSYIKINF